MNPFSLKRWAVLPMLLLACSPFVSAQNFSFNSVDFDARNPCKVFIGVGTSSTSQGLTVDYTIDNTPATQSGVQKGDIILSIDGVAVSTQNELILQRDKHQPGDAFTLQILRNGAPKAIQARFKSCSEEERKAAQDEMARAEKAISNMQEQFKNMDFGERPMLGVYENTDLNAAGLVIESVVPGKGAAAAGLKSGDVVVSVDGKTISGSATLRNALNGHKSGDKVQVIYQRNGQNMQSEVVLSANRFAYGSFVERDPCQVFIGVYTSGQANGAHVDGVIDGTPAKESGIQPGDVILAYNGHAVNSHMELVNERDKSKPGETFRLTISRNGETMEIKARYKSCDTPQTPTVEEKPVEETLAVEREQPQKIDNTLDIKVFEAYPSPTYGPLSIRFEAEAVPTTVNIFDVSGKAVYSKNLPRFNGSFSEDLDLFNNKAGNYILSVQQGDKLYSKQIVLLPRA